MLLLLSVLKGSGGSEIIQGFCMAPGLWYFGGAMTLLGKGFFVGEMGLSGDGTPSPSALCRGSLPLQGFAAELHAAFWWLFQADEEADDVDTLLMRVWWL